jgi:hypothetical protein
MRTSFALTCVLLFSTIVVAQQPTKAKSTEKPSTTSQSRIDIAKMKVGDVGRLSGCDSVKVLDFNGDVMLVKPVRSVRIEGSGERIVGPIRVENVGDAIQTQISSARYHDEDSGTPFYYIPIASLDHYHKGDHIGPGICRVIGEREFVSPTGEKQTLLVLRDGPNIFEATKEAPAKPKPTAPRHSSRTWTLADGTMIEGTFVSYSGGTLTLNVNGEVRKFGLDSFTSADQRFVRGGARE